MRPNIELVLNHQATYEELSQANFDEIVVATGVTPRQLQFEGIDHPKVLSYLQVLKERVPVGQRVAIIERVVLVSTQLNILLMKVKVAV